MQAYRERYKLTFKIDKKIEYLRILGTKFFKKVKNKGKMIINNRGFPLKDQIFAKDKKENELTIIIIFSETIKDKSYMFEHCTSLKKFSQKIEKVKKGYNTIISSHMKNERSNLLISNSYEIYLGKAFISDFCYITNTKFMFCDCTSLHHYNHYLIYQNGIQVMLQI